MLRLFAFCGLTLVDGTREVGAAQRRRLALLVLLAVAGERGMSRDKLAALLWPESAAPNARHSLQQLLYYLRHEVREGLFVGIDPVRLDPSVITSDVGEFEAALARNDLAAASRLYRGPFLDGFFLDGSDEFERWVAGERARLERAHGQALYRLAQVADRQGNHTAAIGWWRKLAESDRLDGRIAAGLMRALAAAGDRNGALRHAEAYAVVVREELGSAVDPTVARLVEELRQDLVALPAGNGAAPPPAASDAAEPAGLGRYRVERELGRGGMATVHLAHDVVQGRTVALKVLHPELAGAVGPERFLREIRIASKLQHPHIVALFDSGTIDIDGGVARPYFTMPYVEGESLRARLEREKQLPLEEALQIARDVASALSYAHARGVVHRDIKPENILLSTHGALVADFGISRAVSEAGSERLTETGLALGTPAYMSPEQATSGSLDGRSDLYALGCVLYEMLAGVPPFLGPTAQAILARHAVDPVPSLRTIRPTVPPSVERAVEKALAKVPADRFATAADFSTSLTGTPAVESLASRPRRRVALAVVGMLTATAITWGIADRRDSASQVGVAPNLIAVLPFRVTGADPALSWVREGLIDLLTIRLAGEGGLRVTEPRAVLSAWQRLAGAGGLDPAPEAALRMARNLGAGRMIDGRVVGTASHLALSASILDVTSGQTRAEASVEGPADSLPAMVDRLAAKLLSVQAGFEAHRLTSLTSASPPAVRAYLAGRAAFRSGRVDDAAQRFEEAMDLDSTFALAGLEALHASMWAQVDQERARQVASAGRHRLSSADQTLLDVYAGQFLGGSDLFAKWRAAAAANPDRHEVWYGLGDAYYHWGALAGIADPLRLAQDAFRRGWKIDSTTASDSLLPLRSAVFAEPLAHMVELAQLEGDSAEVRRLVAMGMAADTTTPQAWYLRWHLALVEGDSARRAFWSHPDRSTSLGGRIGPFATWTGMALADGERAAEEELRHNQFPGFVAMVRHRNSLNRGRPQEALLTVSDPDESPGANLRRRIEDALYWGGDTIAAFEAARQLVLLTENTPRAAMDLFEYYSTVCALGHWQVARGELRLVEAAIRRLRSAKLPGLLENDSTSLTHSAELCAVLLEAHHATWLGLPGARAALETADSLAQTNIFGATWAGRNLDIARVAEAQGDYPRALRAVRRRAGGFLLAPLFFSTFLLEEARLAARTGDRAGAVRAYQHYLGLRDDPEPSVKPEIEAASAELARLLEERPTP